MNQNQPQDLRIEKVFVTPDMAREFLGHNVKNRDRKNLNIKRMAGAMARDEWELNGEALKFDDQGHLVDGQNRCHACILANVGFWTYVVYGVASTAQATMDLGVPRQISDTLKLNGYKNYNTVAGAIGWFVRLEQNDPKAASAALTPKRALQIIKEHPGICDAVAIEQSWRTKRFMSPSAATALAYIFATIDYDDAVGFFRMVADGSGLEATQPCFQLREWFISNTAPAARNRGSIKPWIVVAYVIKAWNYYRTGDHVKMLKFTAGGAHPEEFPTPK